MSKLELYTNGVTEGAEPDLSATFTAPEPSDTKSARAAKRRRARALGYTPIKFELERRAFSELTWTEKGSDLEQEHIARGTMLFGNREPLLVERNKVTYGQARAEVGNALGGNSALCIVADGLLPSETRELKRAMARLDEEEGSWTVEDLLLELESFARERREGGAAH